MPTNNFRSSMLSQETSDGLITLLTIKHDSLPEPYRFCDNSEDIDSREETFLAFPFNLSLPDEKNDEIPQARLSIDNVDRLLVESIRSIQSEVEIVIEIVLLSDPDTVEVGPFRFGLRNVRYNSTTIEGTLQYENLLDRKFPRFAFDPTITPTLFQ